MVQRNRIYKKERVEIATKRSQPSNEARLARKEVLQQVRKIPNSVQEYLDGILEKNKNHGHIDSVKTIGNEMMNILYKEITALND